MSLPTDLQKQIKKIKLENYFDKTHENGYRECGYQNKDGEVHGILRGWNKSGNLVFHGLYDNGKRLETTEWYDTGELYAVQTYNGEGNIDICKIRNKDGSFQYNLKYSW